MKLVNYLMSKFYLKKLEYYDKKADRLNDRAKSLWQNGKDYHKMENRSLKASGKALDSFELYCRWSGRLGKMIKDITVEGCDGGEYKMV